MRFPTALRAWEEAKRSLQAERDAADQEYRTTILAVIGPRRKRRKGQKALTWIEASALDPALAEQIKAAFLERYARLGSQADARVKALEAEVDQAALGYVPIRLPEGQWVSYRWFYSGSYSSTLRGDAYIRHLADEAMDHVRAWGVAAMLDPSTAAGPTVLAGTDRVGVEAIRRKPGLSLREQVRRCWARGRNPRVYNPFLPHGYEERNGLDFFGRETRRGPCLALVRRG